MKLSVLIFAVFLLGCHKQEKRPAINASVFNGYRRPKSNEDGLKRRRSDSIQNNDSLNLIKMLHDALIYANEHHRQRSFNRNLTLWLFPYDAEATLTFGRLFSPRKKHLIIKRLLRQNVVAVDVFVLDSGVFKPVLKQEVQEHAFVSSLTKDINGDSQKDFLIEWYPTAGCCARDVFDVYLYNEKSGRFSSRYEFINPTFSPAEKLIRGVGYGHPRDVEMYKYKWNGTKLDTVEFIFPDSTFTKFHIYKHEYDQDNPKAGRVLAYVPKEYRKIAGYQWFSAAQQPYLK